MTYNNDIYIYNSVFYVAIYNKTVGSLRPYFLRRPDETGTAVPVLYKTGLQPMGWKKDKIFRRSPLAK